MKTLSCSLLFVYVHHCLPKNYIARKKKVIDDHYQISVCGIGLRELRGIDP